MYIRTSGYGVHEDIRLCEVYMEISQDSIRGVQQSSTSFWNRVEEAYNKDKNENWEERNVRSVGARVRTIEKAIRKLNGCMRQIEAMNPSGVSNEDILAQAKILLMQDPSYSKGFKFDHVWNIMKDFEKFNNISKKGNSSAERPMGVKKSKLKRKNDEEVTKILNSIKEDNKQLREMLKKSQSDRGIYMESNSKNMALREFSEENKILMMDLNSIVDPNMRAYWEAEHRRIFQKRAQQSSSTSNTFGDYFTNIGGSDTNLPDY
ncbi:uncharacterized protein LOC126687568 [Mercurialis annua]|uniref:uncharacterized protein LOC126687568 n=1 Tax=Mercurialis annua TaxID=3986 RepID=UPI00215EAE77|nr:uncharacterized protein LOC126687568 [Mercurialis annua]